MCMILKFNVAAVDINLVHSTKKLINQTLEVPILWKKQSLFSSLCHSKTIPSLVQASKTLPLRVSKIAKIGPYPSSVLAWAYASPGGGIFPDIMNTLFIAISNSSLLHQCVFFDAISTSM